MEAIPLSYDKDEIDENNIEFTFCGQRYASWFK